MKPSLFMSWCWSRYLNFSGGGLFNCFKPATKCLMWLFQAFVLYLFIYLFGINFMTEILLFQIVDNNIQKFTKRIVQSNVVMQNGYVVKFIKSQEYKVNHKWRLLTVLYNYVRTLVAEWLIVNRLLMVCQLWKVGVSLSGRVPWTPILIDKEDCQFSCWRLGFSLGTCTSS